MKAFAHKTSIVIGAVALAALNITPPAKADYAGTVLGLNPAAYYRLNETTSVPFPDVATNSGTLGLSALGNYASGAVHPVTGALPGSSDTAANFPDLAGNRVRIDWNPALAVTSPFSVEFWANPAALASGDSSTMCPVAFTQFGDPPGNGSYRTGWLFYQNGGGGWTFRLYGTGNAGYNATVNQTVTAGQWYHVVGVYDGANVTLFVNGQQAATVAAPLPHAPVSNSNIPMSIGARGDGHLGYFRYFGSVDEMAFYTNVLTPAEIQAHYQNGISSTPSQPYDQLVLAKHPAAYYRLGEPQYAPVEPSTLPLAANIGTVGNVANGAYQPGAQTAASGPPYTGLGANTATTLDGLNGYIPLGNPDGLNFASQVTVMAWFKPVLTRGLRNIVAHGYIENPCQELFFRINDGAYQFGSCETSEGTAANGLADQDIGRWVFLVGTYDGTNWNLYRYGELVASTPGASGAGLVASPWSIGSRGDPTLGDGRFFGGTIDEVAIFTNALTQAQIRQVLYSANTPPIIVQQPQPPAGGSVIAGAPVTLTTLAVGTPNLHYQWTKNGTDIPGKTSPVLSFSNVTTNDSGSYALVVTNTFGTVTSSVAVFNVTYPTAPATLLRAVGYPAYDPVTHQASLTKVTLEFSGPLAAEGVNPAHYAILAGGNTLPVSGAQFTNLNMTVILTTSAQTQGATYDVTVTGVTDGVGQALSNNKAQFRAWVQSVANGLRFEYFAGYNTTTVADLTNNPAFPDYPGLVTNLWAFDSRIVFPNDTNVNYGARMRGFFVPPASGNWRFSLRSDDSSVVYLNPNGASPAGKQLVLQESDCCGDWDRFQSNSIPLVAGEAYYIEMLYKEGGGGDYGRVAAWLDGTASPALGTALTLIDPASLAGPAICYPYAPADAGGPIAMAGPTDLTVQANHIATFSVVAANLDNWPMLYQWNRNGVPIQGATNSTYSLVATAADNNVNFTVQVVKLGSVAVSSPAKLTVNPDTDVPTVVSVRGSSSLNTATVTFSELVDATSAQNTANYSIAGFQVLSAVLDTTGTQVVLTLNPPMSAGQVSSITVANVMDRAGHTMTTASPALRAFVLSRGLMQFDFFGNMSVNGTAVSELLSDPRYPNSPDWTGYLSGFDSRTIFPDDSHEAYGSHVTGIFIPPTNGNYVFYIKSDDNSQLYFNATGIDPAGALLQAEEAGCCHGFSATFSPAQTLVGGQMYYIASLQKEGGGGDYVQVAVGAENATTPPDNLLPITPAWVGVLADPVGASVTITQQPANQVAVYSSGPPPFPAIDANFNANNGGFTVSNYFDLVTNPPVGPWSYNAAAGTWTNFGPTDCDAVNASGLNTPAITLTNKAAVMLTFAHRYSFEGGNWDGGQLRVSLNGGPFATVPAINFQQNGYNGAMVGTITPSIAATPGWINACWLNESPGYADGTFITSVAYIGTYKAGDSIRIQFLANWDDCSEGAEPNWEIDSVKVTLGGAEPILASLNIGAESVYRDQPSPYMTYFWQKNTGSGFVDLPGTGTSAEMLENLGFSESGAQFRCVVYGLGSSITSAVATVSITVPLSFSQPAPGTLQLSWPLPPPPSPVATFVLEQSPSMAPGSWTTVPPASYQTTVNTVYINVPVPQTSSGLFYRLRRT